ncbi:hypothetical protein BGZ73_009143 [Actinomortierella ambigua]|nr:hypothetical protein BGZ73_009143 [Actinomortierella ambigua]
MSHPQSSSSNNLLGLPPIGKRTSRDSPPGSQGSSRRSSLADIPKFLSSLRRGSASTGSDSSQPPTGSYQPPARVSGFMARNSICEENFLGGRGGSSLRDGDLAFGPSSPEEEYNSEGHEEDDAEYNAVFQGDDDPTLGPNVVARLATLKPPPKDVYSQGRPPKSILKKGCITAPGAINSSTAGGTGQAKNGVLNKKTGPNTGNSLSSASVHPMANDLGPNSWPPAVSHRANLVTRSPVPNHQQQQQHIQQFQKAHNCHTSLKLPEALSAATFHHQQQQEHTPPGFFHHSSANDSTHPLDNNAWNAPWSSASSHQGHGAAIPADIRGGGKEGAIAPCDRGGEPSQGDVEVQVTGPMARLHLRPQGMGDPYAPPTMNGDVQMNSGKPENDCKLVVMVVDPDNHVTARTTSQAQASGGAYLQSAPSTAIMGGGGQSGVYSAPPATIGARGSVISSQYQSKAAAAAAAAAAARRIGFLSTVEIIPAHRKSEYNRRSDKNATFKILTPDMKGEIRDELNAYKMREMAVHVESMGNTAFH